MTMRLRFAGMCIGGMLLAAVGTGTHAAQMSELSIDQQIEMVRALNEASRQATVAANVSMSQETADKFWPAYRDYRGEVSKLNDQLKRVVLNYAEGYENLGGEQAYELSEQVLDLQIERDKLKKKYLKRFSKASSALEAARVMQIENKLDALAQMELAIEIPLVRAR